MRQQLGKWSKSVKVLCWSIHHHHDSNRETPYSLIWPTTIYLDRTWTFSHQKSLPTLKFLQLRVHFPIMLLRSTYTNKSVSTGHYYFLLLLDVIQVFYISHPLPLCKTGDTKTDIIQSVISYGIKVKKGRRWSDGLANYPWSQRSGCKMVHLLRLRHVPKQGNNPLGCLAGIVEFSLRVNWQDRATK